MPGTRSEAKKEGLPFLSWDRWDLTEEYIEYLMEEEDLSEDKAREKELTVDHESWEWDELCTDLTGVMETLHPDLEVNKPWWRADGSGLGWQRRSGYLDFVAKDGAALLQAVLPKTECSFRIYVDDGEIRIVNSHHDAMGELYVIKPAGDPDA